MESHHSSESKSIPSEDGISEDLPNDRLGDSIFIKLEKTWKVIRSSNLISGHTYLSKCKTNTCEYGEGLNIFRFLPVGDSAKIPYNCEYYYADIESDMWKFMMDSLENSKSFKNKYKHGLTYAICISLPYGVHDDSIQSIKLFSVDDDSEIQF
jgi:hypothetical protein